MVKLPISPNATPPAYVEDRTQFLHDYGALLSLWSEFELAIEVKIAQLVGMAPKDASIVLGGLNFGSKPAILYSLLSQRGDDATAQTVRAVISHTRRNALVHGVSGGDADEKTFVFFKREIDSAYKVNHIGFTADTFNQHFETFRALYKAAQDAMGVTFDNLEAYGREAGLFEPTPPRPQGHPRRAENG